MTPWLLPLFTGNSLCCTEALPLLLPISTQRPALYFGLAWRRLQQRMVRLAGLGPWRSGLIPSLTSLLPRTLIMCCPGPGRTPCLIFVVHSCGQLRWTYREGGLGPLWCASPLRTG